MLSATITPQVACAAGRTITRLFDAIDPQKRAEFLEEADSALALMKAVELDAAKYPPGQTPHVVVIRRPIEPSLN
jgi:hypothetical protein